MNKSSWLVVNFAVFLLLALILASLQSSLIHWVFGWRPTIQGVVVILVYASLYRKPPEGLLFVVVTCYATGLLSVMMTSLTIFTGIAVFLLIQVLRTRVYSSNPFYFTWTALACVLAFDIINWAASVLFVKPVRPHPLDWLVEVLLTALVVRALYALCLWLDKKTKRLSLTELNS